MSALETGQNSHPEVTAERWRGLFLEASAELERLRAEVHGWQPIETAPKDGCVILVNDTTPGWAPWTAAKWLESQEWSGWVYDDDAATDNNPMGPRPTYWLRVPPLPEPPKGAM